MLLYVFIFYDIVLKKGGLQKNFFDKIGPGPLSNPIKVYLKKKLFYVRLVVKHHLNIKLSSKTTMNSFKLVIIQNLQAI